MKINLKRIVRIFFFIVLIVALFITLILQPGLSYKSKTIHGNFIIFHNSAIDSLLFHRLDQTFLCLNKSEFYDPALQLKICLNDGSFYPSLMHILRGKAFAWGFYNIIVLQGEMNSVKNNVQLNGYKWNLTQLLTHEAIHCFQLNKLGLMNSNPVAGIPEWKWEGYPEYIAREDSSQQNLSKNINAFLNANKNNSNGWIQFNDSSGTVIPYYHNWLLVQYCMNIQKMSYENLLEDPADEKTIEQQMMNWYLTHQLKNHGL